MKFERLCHDTFLMLTRSFLVPFIPVVTAGLLPATGSAQNAPAAKRPHISGLSHVDLYTHDLAKSRAFYKDFLGYAEPYSVDKPESGLRSTWIKINDRQSIEPWLPFCWYFPCVCLGRHQLGWSPDQYSSFWRCRRPPSKHRGTPPRREKSASGSADGGEKTGV